MTRINPPAPFPEDERAVRDLVARCEAAWNAGDSFAYAQLMAEDADFVGILGERYQGRDIVELGHRHIFDTIYKGSRVGYTIERLRFLKPDVAVVIMHQKMTSHLPQSVIASTSRQRELSDTLHDSELRATLTAAKLGGQWQIVTLHNTSVASVVTGHT